MSLTRRGLFILIGAAIVGQKTASTLRPQLVSWDLETIGINHDSKQSCYIVWDSVTSIQEHLMQKYTRHAQYYGMSPERLRKELKHYEAPIQSHVQVRDQDSRRGHRTSRQDRCRESHSRGRS